MKSQLLQLHEHLADVLGEKLLEGDIGLFQNSTFALGKNLAQIV